MATYIEYELEDGSKFLVEVKELEGGGVVKAANRTDKDGNIIVKAGKKFGEALDGVQAQAKEFIVKLKPTAADEIEVKFSLKSTGELGNFAVGSVGVEAAYEVTLKWKNEKKE
ncbi:MAG: CU044_2847 family protein [Chloroflexota bacterium]